MSRSRYISMAVVTALLLFSLSYSYAAAPKAGAFCAKAGKKQVVSGKTFTCVKKGKKLVWSKGVKVSVAPKPEVTSTPTPTPSIAPSPISTPNPTPNPTPTALPSSSPTEVIAMTLKTPNLKNISFRAPKLMLTLEVEANAIGAFIKIDSLGVDKKMSMTPKDVNGVVRIALDINKTLTERRYDVRFFAYGDGTESPCCAGTSFNSGIPPKADEPTLPFGNSEINIYVTPPVYTDKPISALSSTAEFEDLSTCRLPDGDPQLTNMTIGFPLPPGRVDFTKKAIVQLLPVSFSDVQASTNPLSDYDNGVSAMKKFWESQSFVGSQIEVRSPSTYKQLPNPVLSYELSSSLFGFQGQKYSAFVRYVIGQYESEINFSGVSTVVVVVPPSTTGEQIGTWVVDTQNTFVTNEGNIYNYMLTGTGDRKNESAMWVHEYGHALGLTDMRFVDPVNSTIQRPEGLGVFDIMGSGNPAPETLLWSRFLLNILAPKQVLCISRPGASTHWIRPLPERSTELKGLIIPTGTYTALVVESRRSYGYDSFLSPRDQGALVYRMDTRVPYKRSPAQIIQPARSTDKEWYTDSALRLGEFVIADGWKISVVESGVFGDVVKVEKA